MVEYAIVHYAKRLMENREHRKKKDTEEVSNLTGYIQRLYLGNGGDGFEKLFRQPEKILGVVRWVPCRGGGAVEINKTLSHYMAPYIHIID